MYDFLCNLLRRQCDNFAYKYEVESRAGYPEMLDPKSFWGFFIYILLLNVKNLLSVVWRRPTRHFKAEDPYFSTQKNLNNFSCKNKKKIMKNKNISYVNEVESPSGYPEMLDHGKFWGFSIYILLLNVKNLPDVVWRRPTRHFKAEDPYFSIKKFWEV